MNMPCQAKGCEDDAIVHVDGFHFCSDHHWDYLDYVEWSEYHETRGNFETYDDEMVRAWRRTWEFLFETADNGSEGENNESV